MHGFEIRERFLCHCNAHCNIFCFFVFSHSWLAILILLAYMAMVIVILLNVLIAQLSFTYSEAKKNAKLQYAVDRMIIITRLEHSRFARFVSVYVLKGNKGLIIFFIPFLYKLQ